MLSYFKAAKRLYNPRDFHASDIEAGAKRPGMPGEGRVRAELHHRRPPRLRERRAVARLVGQVQRRAVESHEAQPPVRRRLPSAHRTGERHGQDYSALAVEKAPTITWSAV